MSLTEVEIVLSFPSSECVTQALHTLGLPMNHLIMFIEQTSSILILGHCLMWLCSGLLEMINLLLIPTADCSIIQLSGNHLQDSVMQYCR